MLSSSARGLGRRPAITVAWLLRRGTSSSPLTYAPAHTCDGKKTRAPTHAPCKVQTSSSRPSTSSLLPQFTVSPSVAPVVFRGETAEGRGASERKGKDAEGGGERWGERKERRGKRERQKNQGDEKEERKRGSRGVALLLVTWNSVPHHRGIRAPRLPSLIPPLSLSLSLSLFLSLLTVTSPSLPSFCPRDSTIVAPGSRVSPRLEAPTVSPSRGKLV